MASSHTIHNKSADNSRTVKPLRGASSISSQFLLPKIGLMYWCSRGRGRRNHWRAAHRAGPSLSPLLPAPAWLARGSSIADTALSSRGRTGPTSWSWASPAQTGTADRGGRPEHWSETWDSWQGRLSHSLWCRAGDMAAAADSRG